MFRAVLDRDHPSIVDFGLGDESYKEDWTPLKEYRVGWLAFNKTTTRGRWENIKHDLGVIRKRAMVP